jgi:excisionase family DNA binding protein
LSWPIASIHLGDTVSALLTFKEAAEALGCSVANIYNLRSRGEIAVVTIGAKKGYRIAKEEIERFVNARTGTVCVTQQPGPEKPVVLRHLKRRESRPAA